MLTYHLFFLNDRLHNCYVGINLNRTNYIKNQINHLSNQIKSLEYILDNATITQHNNNFLKNISKTADPEYHKVKRNLIDITILILLAFTIINSNIVGNQIIPMPSIKICIRTC